MCPPSGIVFEFNPPVESGCFVRRPAPGCTTTFPRSTTSLFISIYVYISGEPVLENRDLGIFLNGSVKNEIVAVFIQVLRKEANAGLHDYFPKVYDQLLTLTKIVSGKVTKLQRR